MAHEKLRPQYLFDAEKIEKQKQLTPECFEDGKINFETLRQNLGDWTQNEEDPELEHFGLFWPGKRDARKAAAIPPEGTLEPIFGEGLNSDGSLDEKGENESKNIFIEGENLEVLKLLQKSYFEKVKMIYIDPPYNTGTDLIYDDDFSESLQDYLKRTGKVDEEGKAMTTNKKSDGRFHSKWLSMMYPRLRLAKNLLREDGFIFISIDENESHHLRCLMNEIFGEENFIETITWNKRVPKNDKGIGNIHETILLFVKNSFLKPQFMMAKDGLDDVYEFVNELKKKKVPIPDAESQLKKFYDKKGYDRGITLYNSLDKDYRIWGKINVSWPNSNTEGPRYDVLHPKLKIPSKVPERGWRWKKDSFDDLLDYDNTLELHDGSFMCGRIWFAKDENTQPSSIKYLDEVNDLLLRSILSYKSSGGIEVEKHLGKNVFSYPKPLDLIKTLIKSNIAKDDIILDFFAGSSTTGSAVLEINKENDLNLSFIQVQLPQIIENEGDSKTAYKFCIDNNLEPNLFQISRTRLIREIVELNQGDSFKVFKWKVSNFKPWKNYNGTSIKQLENELELFNENPLRLDYSKKGLLTEILLIEGFTLCSSLVQLKKLNLNKVSKVTNSYNQHSLLICLDDKIEKETISNLELRDDDVFICLDSAISSEDKLRLSDKGLIKTI